VTKYKLTVNTQEHTVDVAEDTPLLWVLRDKLKLTGTKFGCGIAQCGACTVHLNGTAVRSCVLPISSVSGEVTTIEGLSENGKPTDDDIDSALVGNYCRCGTYIRIRKAVHSAATFYDATKKGATGGGAE